VCVGKPPATGGSGAWGLGVLSCGPCHFSPLMATGDSFHFPFSLSLLFCFCIFLKATLTVDICHQLWTPLINLYTREPVFFVPQQVTDIFQTSNFLTVGVRSNKSDPQAVPRWRKLAEAIF